MYVFQKCAGGDTPGPLLMLEHRIGLPPFQNPGCPPDVNDVGHSQKSSTTAATVKTLRIRDHRRNQSSPIVLAHLMPALTLQSHANAPPITNQTNAVNDSPTAGGLEARGEPFWAVNGKPPAPWTVYGRTIFAGFDCVRYLIKVNERLNCTQYNLMSSWWRWSRATHPVIIVSLILRDVLYILIFLLLYKCRRRRWRWTAAEILSVESLAAVAGGSKEVELASVARRPSNAYILFNCGVKFKLHNYI